MSEGLNRIEDLVAEIALGRMVIVVDDSELEAEGALIIAAECVDAAAINFMAKHGRGLICVPTTSERLQQLDIPGTSRAAVNQQAIPPDLQFSADAARGITTGIGAADRARTIQVMADPAATPSDLVRPGHVFFLRAEKGGVLHHAGHTEAAVDLAQLAGLRAVGVICEIMKNDGTMARLPQLLEFADTHNLKIGSIADLIRFRLANGSDSLN